MEVVRGSHLFHGFLDPVLLFYHLIGRRNALSAGIRGIGDRGHSVRG